MRELDSAVMHGQSDADTVGRLIESARYAATLARMALDAGVVDVEPSVELVPVERANDEAARVLVDVVGRIVGAVSPSAERAAELQSWADAAIRAGLAGVVMPRVPDEAVRVAEPSGRGGAYPAPSIRGAVRVRGAGGGGAVG